MTLEMNVSDTYNIYEAVEKIFDELVTLTEIQQKLHPSEEVNRNFRSYRYKHYEIYDFINSYHAFCLLCNQHFYSQSIRNDINSFFQKHINSSYHISHKFVKPYPNDKPIFEWENWLVTGRCNICNLSGINSYIINSVLTPAKIIENHICIYDKEFRETNQNVVKKIQQVRKYCSLEFLADKFLKNLNENVVVCLLCGISFNGKRETSQYHLNTDYHLKKFCAFIFINFKFAMKDLLNGFNLEKVTKLIMTKNVVPLGGVVVVHHSEEENCLITSNDAQNIYLSLESKTGFSPKHIIDLLKLHPIDLIFDSKCLLCDEKVLDFIHMKSESHLKKMISLNADTSDRDGKYQLYLKNRERRLLPYKVEIKMYHKLQQELNESGLKMGIPFKPDLITALAIVGKQKKIETNWENKLSHTFSTKNLMTALKSVINSDLKHSKKDTLSDKSEKVVMPDLKKYSKSSLNADVNNVANQGGQTEARAQTSAKFDFRKLENNVKKIMDLFEDNLIENVGKTTHLLYDSLHLENTEVLQSDEIEDEETSKISNSSSDSVPSALESPETVVKSPEEAEVEESFVAGKMENLMLQHEEVQTKSENDFGEEQSEEEIYETDGNGGDEILIISGLSKIERKAESISSRFKEFGKIKFVFFQRGMAILAFKKSGLAKEVASGPPIFLNGQKLDIQYGIREGASRQSLSKELITLLETPSFLTDFIFNLLSESFAIGSSEKERLREEQVRTTIIMTVANCYPYSKCFRFGSRESGLTLSNSDLDVFLDCGGMFEGDNSMASQRSIVNVLASGLSRSRDCAEIIVVRRARVPIVSFLHKPTKLHCDVSFKNGLSVQNTSLLKFILSLDWRVRPVILFIKYWADINCLHGPPFFSSYAVAMMVIFYFQQLSLPILPSIETLQINYVGHRLTISGWDCNFSTNSSLLPKVRNLDTLPKLLLGFFDFYANFDYSKYVVSPLTGKPLPREAFCKMSNVKLPMALKRHILNFPTPIENLVSKKYPLCIMDPFDLSHILTKSFTEQRLKLYIDLCKKSAGCLSKWVS